MNFSAAMFYENYLTSVSIQTLLFQACLPTRQNGVENRGVVHSKMMHILVQEFVSSRKYVVSYLVFFASFRFLEE